jgi:hypothetical protein
MLQAVEQVDPRGLNMKMNNLIKLSLTLVFAIQFVNPEVAHAKRPKSYREVLKTTNKKALQDPYFQIKSVKITQVSNEEALEFNNDQVEGLEDDQLTNIVNKGFAPPQIPNIPPILPPQNSGGLVSPGIGNPGNGNPGFNNPGFGNSNIDVPGTPAGSGTFNSVIMVIDRLIAIGQKIIPTIKEGKSVVTNNPMASVSVLPRSEGKDPVVHDMGGWSIPVTKHYKIVYQNALGFEVVSFVYSISFQHSGNVDGKGKYLAGIRASARNITISFGFDLDASSQLLQISNIGTQKDVIAGATIEMTYTVKNWTKNITTSESFHVTGDGRLYKLD